MYIKEPSDLKIKIQYEFSHLSILIFLQKPFHFGENVHKLQGKMGHAVNFPA